MINFKLKKEHCPFAVFALIFLTTQCFVTYYEGDDTYFLSTLHQMNLIEFIKMRYLTWSGRVASEFFIGLFTYFNLWIWRLINTLIAIGFITTIASMVKLLIHTELNTSQKIWINSLTVVSFFLIPISVTTRACSWFTGSFFYLWPTYFCLLAMLPFIKSLFQKAVPRRDYIIALLASIYAGYMEQTAAVLFCFGMITLIYLFIKKQQISTYLSAILIVTFIQLIIYKAAPGNVLRFASETQTWYPEFDQLSFIQKLMQGINWTHHHLVMESNFLMLILSLMVSILILCSSRKLIIKLMACIPSLYFIGAVFPFNKLVSQTTSYEYQYDIEGILNKFFFNPMSGRLPAFIAFAIIILLGILLFMSFDTTESRLTACLFYLAALTSGYVIGLSPTIFASGPRIFFLSNILIILILGMLLSRLFSLVSRWPQLFKLAACFFTAIASIQAVIYIGGIAAKTIFKIN